MESLTQGRGKLSIRWLSYVFDFWILWRMEMFKTTVTEQKRLGEHYRPLVGLTYDTEKTDGQLSTLSSCESPDISTTKVSGRQNPVFKESHVEGMVWPERKPRHSVCGRVGPGPIVWVHHACPAPPLDSLADHRSARKILETEGLPRPHHKASRPTVDCFRCSKVRNRPDASSFQLSQTCKCLSLSCPTLPV